MWDVYTYGLWTGIERMNIEHWEKWQEKDNAREGSEGSEGCDREEEGWSWWGIVKKAKDTICLYQVLIGIFLYFSYILC